jgi:hypothetical protein
MLVWPLLLLSVSRQLTPLPLGEMAVDLAAAALAPTHRVQIKQSLIVVAT